MGEIKMQIGIKIDGSYTDPKIIVLTAAMTEDVKMILNQLSENVPQIISGSKNEKVEVIEQDDLIRIYANNRVFDIDHHFLHLGKWLLFPMCT